VFGEQDVNVDSTELLLTDLYKFHQYVVRVVAYNVNGPGPATEELTCHTFSDGITVFSLRAFSGIHFTSEMSSTPVWLLEGSWQNTTKGLRVVQLTASEPRLIRIKSN